MIRALRRDDVPALIPLHADAFRDSMGVRLGDRYLAAFLHWFTRAPDAVGLVDDDGRQIRGYVFGAPDGYGRRLNRDLLGEIALGMATHPGVLLHANFLTSLPSRLVGLMSGRAHPASGHGEAVFALTGIGVAPRHRGHGIAGTLVDAFELEASRRGFARLILDVYADNAPARSLYEKRGWRLARTTGRVLLYEKSCASAS